MCIVGDNEQLNSFIAVPRRIAVILIMLLGSFGRNLGKNFILGQETETLLISAKVFHGYLGVRTLKSTKYEQCYNGMAAQTKAFNREGIEAREECW